jgi:S1-C subfamily serine protease
VITALDSEAVSGSEDLVAAISDREPDEKVTLKIERGSESIALEGRLGTQPARSGLG